MKFNILRFSLGLVFVWVAWTTYWDAGLYGDNVEQFVWVHSIEWGYPKHPPMPTWLLGLAIQLVGQHSWLTNALAAICFAITGALTWQIARELFDKKTADIAIVLWTLQQCFSVSAQIYNHNTVLVMFLAATVYAVLRAKRGGGESRAEQLAWWLGAGVFAGCAMLSKYQAALPLFVLLITVCIANRQPPRQLVTGVTLATAGFAIVFSPHVYWAVINDFPALRYASGAIESGGFVKRLAWIGSFFANQIRMVFPLLLALGISFALCKIRRAPSHKNLSAEISANEASQVSPTSVWMWCLVWAPVVILIVASLISGSQLRNHWGVQLFQFLPIWLAARWQGNRVLKLSNLVPAMLVAHAIGFGYYAIKQSDPMAAQAERRADSSYPAQSMAQAALAHWKAQTNCPLKIVQGDFEAGLVSAFTAEFPVVYSGPVATPWVAPAQLALQGVLYVLDMNTPLPTEATAARKWFFRRTAFPSAAAAETGKFVQFAVRLPMSACSP